MSEIRQLAAGKWRGILTALGVDESYLQNKHMPCPVCDGVDRYRFDDKNGNGEFFCNNCGPGDGFELLMRINKWDFKTCADHVRKIIGSVQPVFSSPKNDPLKLLKRIAKIAKPVTGDDEASDYLRNRGLKIIPKSLFYCEALRYYDGKDQVGIFGAMLAVVRDKAGEALTYHVTYLHDGHKADVPHPRKIMPPLRPIAGAAIRLYPVAQHLVIAEGIETAIAAHEATGLPAWATISASGMEVFDPPDGITTVTIIGDNDTSYTGQKAAYTLAHRLTQKKIKANVIINETHGKDYLDDWIREKARLGSDQSNVARIGGCHA